MEDNESWLLRFEQISFCSVSFRRLKFFVHPCVNDRLWSEVGLELTEDVVTSVLDDVSEPHVNENMQRAAAGAVAELASQMPHLIADMIDQLIMKYRELLTVRTITWSRALHYDVIHSCRILFNFPDLKWYSCAKNFLTFITSIHVKNALKVFFLQISLHCCVIDASP